MKSRATCFLAVCVMALALFSAVLMRCRRRVSRSRAALFVLFLSLLSLFLISLVREAYHPILDVSDVSRRLLRGVRVKAACGVVR